MGVEVSGNKNILLLWDRMGDYHRARWKALQASLSDREVFAADLGLGDSLYKWQATDQDPNYVQLTEQAVELAETRKALSKFKALIHEKQIGFVCIPGYGRRVYLLMLLVSRMYGLKTLLFAESWYEGSILFDSAKGKVLRYLVDKFLVSGVRAEKHFNERLGIPAARILKGYSVVDNAHFRPVTSQRQHTEKVLLCIARYAEEKNLLLLIDAFLQSELPAKEWKLRLVGEGPLKDDLSAKITQASSVDKILLHGWESYEKLPAIYMQASCFILPSLFEPWGLVVNEAMAAALPIILSQQVGCQPDLVDEKNGWVFEGGNKGVLRQVLDALGSVDPTYLDVMGAVSAERIKAFDLQSWVDQVKKGFSL